MIHPRMALTRVTQEFFHTHLIGIYKWDQVEHAPPDRITKSDIDLALREGRERPDGKFREMLRMQFGDYDLMVESSNEAPPLGRIVLTGRDDTVEGPIDPSTWARIAAHIKQSKRSEI